MSKKDNSPIETDIKSHLKKYKTALVYSFIIGLFIGSMPFIYKYRESLRVQKLIEEQIKINIQNKEKICKQDNSDYKKFLSLGFPKTAIEKFNICMKEQWTNIRN